MANLKKIKLDSISKSVKEHQKPDPETYRGALALAKKIKRKTIIHINSTQSGGGVAEILRSQVPIEKSLGLKSHWLVIEAEREFFVITKKIHNLLQGKAGFLSSKEKEFYLSVNRELGKKLAEFLKQFKNGVVVIHDPQSLPMINAIPDNFSSLLRLHIDLSSPNPSTLEFLRPFIANYDLVIVSNKDYLLPLPWIKKSKLKIIYPAIDSFSDKNKSISPEAAKGIIAEYGINPTKPIIAQVSRFDPWKGQSGVIQAYYLAKNKIPDLQLVQVGFFEAQDDPEAASSFKRIRKHAKGDPDIHLFYNPKQLKNISDDILINALCVASQIMIQGSIREGFGLITTEAMWKGKPVIARVTSGSRLQIKNKKNGILVASPEEMAEWIVYLLKNEKTREKLGRSAKKSVERNFLISRYIVDNLKQYLVK
ncbi:glycosyltransferase [Candidatus Parcubacteria bacterium]|nr:glycosyltransferase [Patescibacteria group bacterium]MBU4477253.1 glycosyltransferase [Patescibacteria group bacterium]MCG2699346.1 glycosyltransferase [Candidatus Parcubacteria bacterium]